MGEYIAQNHMVEIERIEKIIEAYERFETGMEATGIRFGGTRGDGFWTPTNLRSASIFLAYARQKRLIVPSEPIADVSSGDGRMLALFDLYGFKQIIGIERDKRLYKASAQILSDLAGDRLVRHKNIAIVNGNLTDSEAYENGGVPFDSIRYFFMGINSGPLERLAKKIEKESPEQTRLIVYGLFLKEGEEPKISLKLEDRFHPDLPLVGDFLTYIKPTAK